MKIERISDNQIRCTLNKADLAGKETLLNELAFGSDKAKGLFRELMKKASQELGFETNNIPLMVEAIPVSQECLILVVTKVEDADQFNDRYEKLVNSKISSGNMNLEIPTEFSISSTMLLTAICPNWLMQCIWPLWIPTVTYTAFLPWKK